MARFKTKYVGGLLLFFGLLNVRSYPLSGASTEANPTKLTPLGSFEVSERIPFALQSKKFQITKFVAHETGLYFLIGIDPPAPSQKVILHTDEDGTYRKLISLPPEKESQVDRSTVDFGVDDSGYCFVLQGVRPQNGEAQWRFLIYDAAGTFKGTVPLQERVSGFSLLSNNISCLYQSGTLEQISQVGERSKRQFQFSGSLPRGVKMCGLSNNKLIVLDGVATARVHVLDPVTGSVRTSALDHIPEVRKALNSYPPESLGPPTPDNPNAGSAVILSGMASTKLGDVYVQLASFYVPEGAVVLKLNSDGQVVGSLRCILPRSEKRKTKGNPDGYLTGARFIGVTEKSLFIASMNAVARYQR